MIKASTGERSELITIPANNAFALGEFAYTFSTGEPFAASLENPPEEFKLDMEVDGEPLRDMDEHVFLVQGVTIPETGEIVRVPVPLLRWERFAEWATNLNLNVVQLEDHKNV